MEPDWYEILQVSPRAEAEVVAAAYRRLSRKYHPDVDHSPAAQAHQAELNAAYEVLSDSARRAAYDRGRAAEAPVAMAVHRLPAAGSAFTTSTSPARTTGISARCPGARPEHLLAAMGVGAGCHSFGRASGIRNPGRGFRPSRTMQEVTPPAPPPRMRRSLRLAPRQRRPRVLSRCRPVLPRRRNRLQALGSCTQQRRSLLLTSGQRSARPLEAIRNWVVGYFPESVYAGDCATTEPKRDIGRICGIVEQRDGNGATGWVALTFSDSNGYRMQIGKSPRDGLWRVIAEPELPLPHPSNWPPLVDATIGRDGADPVRTGPARVRGTGGECLVVRTAALDRTAECLAESTVVSVISGPILLKGYEWYSLGAERFVAGRFLVRDP